MRSGPNGRSMYARVRGRAVAALAAVVLGLSGVALAAAQAPAVPPAAQTSQAPAPPAQASTNQAQTSAKPGQSAPAQAPAAAPAQTDTKPAQTAVVPVPAVASGAPSATPPAATAAGGDTQSQTIEQETADLLKMATDLQAEINKTKVATLSLAVVRKASAIEELAKKMKSQP